MNQPRIIITPLRGFVALKVHQWEEDKPIDLDESETVGYLKVYYDEDDAKIENPDCEIQEISILNDGIH